MARYSDLLGRRVEVHYRAGDILLPASGTLVADSGRSVFLEQHMLQRGQERQFRWEIPYQYIVRLEHTPSTAADPADDGSSAQKPESSEQPAAAKTAETLSASTAAANTSGVVGGALPLQNRPKPA
jgi:hypothetical protein